MRWTVALPAALACAQPLAAQVGSRLWRPEERTILAGFGFVTAVAASQEMLYVVSASGLGVLERPFARWKPPVTHLDGYPREPVGVALADPLDRSVWLGTTTRVLNYSPTLLRFESVLVPGGVIDLMFDRDDTFRGIYVLTPTGWWFLPRGSLMLTQPPSIPPPRQQLRPISVDQALDMAPYLASGSSMWLTDEIRRSYRYTAAALAWDSQDLYMGTNGLGVLAVDALTTNVRRMPFGLLATSVGAVVATRGGVWAATGPMAPRVGFTFVGSNLQEYRFDEGRGGGYRFAFVTDVLQRGEALWAVTDAGVVRVVPGERPEVMLSGFGLGTEQGYALAQTSSGVWAGTERGLVFLSDHGETVFVDERVREPIYALAASGDTVWVGGRRGLGVTWEGSHAVYVPRHAEGVAFLTDPVVALALTGDTLIAANLDRLMWRAPGEEWVIERVLTGDLGEVTALVGDDEGVWVGGFRGVAYFRPGLHEFRVFNAPGDVPGPVRDIAVDDKHVWAATPAGMVRFEKRALKP
jgi:ligand-binding sensor domain-containing protein